MRVSEREPATWVERITPMMRRLARPYFRVGIILSVCLSVCLLDCRTSCLVLYHGRRTVLYQATFYMYVTCAFRDRGLKGYACSALLALGLDDSGAPRPGARLRRWCRRGKRGRFPFMTPCGCRKCCGPPARAGLPASSSKDVVYTHIEHGGGSRPACERR